MKRFIQNDKQPAALHLTIRGDAGSSCNVNRNQRIIRTAGRHADMPLVLSEKKALRHGFKEISPSIR
jgi:hypothetical protein